MYQRLLVLVFVVGCAAKQTQPTIRGADIYAHVGELRASGVATVPSSKRPIEVRMGEFLVDRSRNQVFVVDQVVEGCTGNPDDDASCVLVLLRDQRFTVTKAAPKPPDDRDDGGDDLDDLTKARLVTGISTAALAVGAFKCEAFDGCRELLGITAAVDGLLFLVLFTGMH